MKQYIIIVGAIFIFILFGISVRMNTVLIKAHENGWIGYNQEKIININELYTEVPTTCNREIVGEEGGTISATPYNLTGSCFYESTGKEVFMMNESYPYDYPSYVKRNCGECEKQIFNEEGGIFVKHYLGSVYYNTGTAMVTNN